MMMMCIQSATNPHEQGQRLAATSVIMHENFNTAAYWMWDIAIIRLRDPLVFNDYVQPVCIPSTPVDAGTECFATGWGATHSKSIEFCIEPKPHFQV